MQNVTAEMAKKTAGKNSVQVTSLDQRYHQIGISAVAAAVRYQGSAKNPAYAPVPTRWTDYSDDAA
ncbi:MAG TPA: hypothetical protein VH206_05685 [Xanthobacteraceae bacterium]|jgi:hypothetical protein|nr:hypothetical protein [Xanthobacteraceae bacterium]